MSLKNKTLLMASVSLALGLTLSLRPAPAAAEEPHGPNWLSVVYHEEITIAATPAKIFGVILDLAHYGEWNPWLTHAEGDMVEGGAVTVQADGKVRFVNELIIDGLLAHLVDLTTGASLRAGMQGENAGLKARAESL